MIERCEFKKYKAATVTVPGLSRNVHIVEDSQAVATGCTGLRVWSCAVLLASELILQADSMRLKGANVVELGCGCGLVGLVAALLGAHVLLTDRDEECLALASASAAANAEGIGAAEGSVKTSLLDWDYPQAAEGIPYGASTWVIGSDVLYETTAATQLARVIAVLLAPGEGRFLALLGVRDVAVFDAFLTSSYMAGLELADEPRSIEPCSAAVEKAQDHRHDIEIIQTAHQRCGYIRVEMRKARGERGKVKRNVSTIKLA